MGKELQQNKICLPATWDEDADRTSKRLPDPDYPDSSDAYNAYCDLIDSCVLYRRPYRIAYRFETLILNIFPTDKSLMAMQPYYGIEDYFWTILYDKYGGEIYSSYSDRLRFLSRHKIGIWSVIYRCVRDGDRNENIEKGSVQYNDIVNLLQSQDGKYVQRIIINGKSHKKDGPLYHLKRCIAMWNSSVNTECRAVLENNSFGSVSDMRNSEQKSVCDAEIYDLTVYNEYNLPMAKYPVIFLTSTLNKKVPLKDQERVWHNFLPDESHEY